MKKVFGFIIVVLLVTSSFVSTDLIVEAAMSFQSSITTQGLGRLGTA